MKYMYGFFTGYLRRLPTHDLDRANEIRDFVLKHIPLDSGKQFITRLSACCDWARKAGMISKNPFVGMATEIKPPKSRNADNDINPFTASEREDTVGKASQW